MPINPIYKIKAELMNTDLKIWREFEVTNHIPMSRLGYIVMSMFNMEGNHLFRFEVPSSKSDNSIYYIEIPNPYEDTISECKTLATTKTKLKEVFSKVKDTIKFNYDFGDDWEIKLTLEEIYVNESIHGREFPRVISGAGYGIIEDCGGVGGLEDIVTAFKKKCGDEYEQYSEWLGKKEFDINKFDLEFMNYVVKQATVIFKANYEE